MSLRLLDLFCGAGGAGRGCQAVGFEVVGVDIAPQPRYPGLFRQEDALLTDLEGFDAYHASPPCQKWSPIGRNREAWPDLIGAIRTRLAATGKPYVIENVTHAPLRRDLLLCGSMFGLRVQRHRIFECEGFLALQPTCHHAAQPAIITVTGHGGGRSTPKHRHSGLADALTAMGLGGSGMTRHELVEAIPPAYTHYIGGYLLRAALGEET